MGFKLPNGSDLNAEQLDIINLPTTKDWVIKGALLFLVCQRIFCQSRTI